MTFFGDATEPVPGDLFVGAMGGVPGIGVEVGQILDGDPFRWVTWMIKGRPEIAAGVWPAWMYEHAGIYVGRIAGQPTVVEAEPKGARYRMLPDFDNAGMRYVLWSTGVFPDLTKLNRELIVEAAKRAADKKVGYSVLDYFYLAARHFGLRAKWLEREIEATGHEICSQLDDWTYQQGGYKIFNDGRWNGDVTPQDLAGNFIARARKLHLI